MFNEVVPLYYNYYIADTIQNPSIYNKIGFNIEKKKTIEQN